MELERRKRMRLNQDLNKTFSRVVPSNNIISHFFFHVFILNFSKNKKNKHLKKINIVIDNHKHEAEINFSRAALQLRGLVDK